jgi:transposase
MSLALRASDREELEARARNRSLRADDVRRARLILLLSDGDSYSSIAEKLGCNRSYISTWKRRFEQEGLAGLYARHQGRKRSVLTAAMERDALPLRRP